MEIQTIDVKNVCRCCILPTSDLELAFETFYENELLSKILLDVGKIEIKNDGLSNSICQNCKLAAINAYKFQQMCIESDRSLRILIGSLSNENHQDPAVVKEEDIQLQPQPEPLIEDMKQLEPEDLEYDIADESENFNDNESNSDIENDSIDSAIKELYECSNCSRRFKSKTNLEGHFSKCQQLSNDVINEDESDEEEDDKQEYPCTQCSKVFKKASLLARHKKAHDPNKKPHECSKCNKRFPSNVALMRHDILHSDLVERSRLNRDESQEFTCVVCGRAFKSPDNLASHLKAHKNKANENHEYKCKLCHDIFPSFSDLLRHSKNHIENATHQVL